MLLYYIIYDECMMMMITQSKDADDFTIRLCIASYIHVATFTYCFLYVYDTFLFRKLHLNKEKH